MSLIGYDATLGEIAPQDMLEDEFGISNANLTLGYFSNGQQSGWTSRYSFIPEAGISTLGKYYTFNNGKCYLHHSVGADYNNFYGVAYPSEIDFIFNDNPTVSNEWVSLNYEGSSGWDVVSIEADQEEDITTSVDILDSKWFKKEGKYFAPITGEEPVYQLIPSGVADDDGNYPVEDTGVKQPKAGVKGFYNKVKFRTANNAKQELFAVSAEYHITSV